VSKQIAESLRESGYRPTMVSHLLNGVDLGRVAATRSRKDTRRALGVDDRALLIGTAGRLSPVKGHAGLLRAARIVLEQLPTARVAVAGDGPLAGELRASAVRLGIDRQCLWLGARSDVYDLMSAMDVFVLPSLHEGIPMAVLEAMALGTPVVATNVGGIPEVIQHGTNGLLVPAGDDCALAEACLELAADPTRARALGAAARRTVEEAFSHERSGRDLVDAYRSIACVPRSGAIPLPLRLVPDRAGFNPGKDPRSRVGTRMLLSAGVRMAVDSGARTVKHVLESRQMRRVRRNPARLKAALDSARQVLVVCHGNIIRSPFAARLVARALGAGRSVSVVSAGLEATPGRPPHPTALRLAGDHRIDLSRHTATPIDHEVVASSDVIFVMDVPQLLAFRKRFPAAREKTFLLACLAPAAPLEIVDPFGGDDGAFEKCYRDIRLAADGISRALCSSPGPR
jgi:protein-tyrosine-phosphatase